MPKPMQMVGPGPLIWHVMRYYAHFGHKEFILCLGYGASHIKNFFLTYQEVASNDFAMRGGRIELMHSDISDWSITFVDTGLESAIGERLRRVRSHLDGDEYFLANDADVLTDAPLNKIIDEFHNSGAAASMMIVPPESTFHCVQVSEAGEVKDITPVADLLIWINGGYFVLSREISTRPCGGSRQMREQFSPTAGIGVAGRYRRNRQWPIDREIGVIVRDGQVLGGVMGTIDAIADIGGRGECLKAMQETGWDVEVPKGVVVEKECLPSAEGRRSPTDVDQHVMHRSVRATYQFGFATPGASVHAADNALCRTGLGILHERRRGTRRREVFVEDLSVKCPGKQSAVVPERFWNEDENICEFRSFDAHREMLS